MNKLGPVLFKIKNKKLLTSLAPLSKIKAKKRLWKPPTMLRYTQDPTPICFRKLINLFCKEKPPNLAKSKSKLRKLIFWRFKPEKKPPKTKKIRAQICLLLKNPTLLKKVSNS